jgi:deoxycytidine triphosphate deaminase
MFNRPIRLYPYMRIAQIAFTAMFSRPSHGYGSQGHYQNQIGPQESRYRV